MALHAGYDLIIIWAMAVGTVLIGGFWSGLIRHKEYLHLRRRRSVGQSLLVDRDTTALEQWTWDLILFLVVWTSGFLVAAYFFLDYAEFALKILFCLIALNELYSWLKPVMLGIPFCGKYVVPMKRVPGVRTDVEVCGSIPAFLCLAVGVCIVIHQNAHYAWIVQDILCVALCIGFMKWFRLPNLKVCTIYLTLLFVLDVFIQLVFTQSDVRKIWDESTDMEVLVTDELSISLIHVLVLPRSTSTKLPEGRQLFLVISYDTIFMPGLIVAFCSKFDRLTQNSGIYFIASVIGYGVGLLVVFLSLAFSSQGQPALLYLLPSTLFTTVVIGLCRGELAYLWSGVLPIKEDGFPVYIATSA